MRLRHRKWGDEFLLENKNLIKDYGSVSEAHRDLGISKSTVLRQCNHEIKNKPRCGYYFRYQSEYNEKGFVL